MKRLFSFLSVIAIAFFAFTQSVMAGDFDSFLSTAESPKWFVIKGAYITGTPANAGYSNGKAITANGLGKTMNFNSYSAASNQMFRFEKVAGQDSVMIINKMYPTGAILNDGGAAGGVRYYNTPSLGNPKWAVEILADQGEGVKYMFKAARPNDESGDAQWAELHAQSSGSLLVSWMSSSEGPEYFSASTWFIDVPGKDQDALDNIVGDVETFLGTVEGNIGTGIGQYSQTLYNELFDLYAVASDLDVTQMTDAEFYGWVDNLSVKFEAFKSSRVKLPTQFPQTSTAANPKWYVLTCAAKAGDSRAGLAVTKGDNSTLPLYSKTFEANNNKQLWRVEEGANGLFSLICKDGGAIMPMVGSGNSARFYASQNPDTAVYEFKFSVADPYDPAGDPKVLNIATKSGQLFHQGNSGLGWFIINYNVATDNGSLFSFTNASDLVSKELVFSTEANPVWYRIKSKRETTKATPRPYWTAFGGVDSIFRDAQGAETGRTQIFGRTPEMVVASGDSALWRLEKVRYTRPLVDDAAQTEEVDGVLIINKLTGKCLNAYNHGQSKTIRLVGRNEAVADTLFPYWNLLDKNRDVWEMQSYQRRVVDGTVEPSTTYANMGGKTEVVTYSVQNDGGNLVYFEDVTLDPEGVENTTNSSIKVVVEKGRIVVYGTEEKPSVFTITGARVDVNKKLTAGVYLVNVNGKSAKVVVTE